MLDVGLIYVVQEWAIEIAELVLVALLEVSNGLFVLVDV